MDVDGLYSKIMHGEGLPALRKQLRSRKEKYVSTDTIKDIYRSTIKKKNMFNLGKRPLIKFAPPCSILFMAELEEEIKESGYKLYLWWKCIGDIFFLWEHGKDELKYEAHLNNHKLHIGVVKNY